MVESVGINLLTHCTYSENGREIMFCVYIAKNEEQISFMEVKGVNMLEITAKEQYYGIFAVKPTETAVARKRLCKNARC
jgi:hypothetical protein